jgi:uncharacterized membrane protein YfcA
MNTSGRRRQHRLTPRIAVGGAILGCTSTAVGLFILIPIINRSSSDDSPIVTATILLVFLGLAAIVLSVALYVGDALWRWSRSRWHRHINAGNLDAISRPAG